MVRSPWAVGRKPGVADTSPLSPPLPGTPCRRLLTLLSLAAFSNEKTAHRLLSHLWTGPLCESIPPPGLWVSHSCPSPGKVLLSSASPCRFFVLLGNIQAVALRDIFVQAQNRDSLPPSLQIEEPEWEKRRSVNLSELIDVYRWAAVWSCHGETRAHACLESRCLVGWQARGLRFGGKMVPGLHRPPPDLVAGS